MAKRIIKPSPKLLLPIIIDIGALIRLYHLGYLSLWYDELYTVWAIRLPLDSLIWEVPASGHPPLYYLVSHFWFWLGHGDAWVRSISWVCGVLTIWLAYLIGKELYSERTGLWAAAIAAVMPYLVWFSQDATDYSWFIAVYSLSFYLLIRARNRGGAGNWSAYVAATAAALFSHYYGFFIVMAEAAFFLILPSERRQLKAWALCQLVLVAITPLWLLYDWGASTWASLHFPPPAELLRGLGDTPAVLLQGSIGFRKSILLTSFLLLLALAAPALFSAAFRKVLLGKKMIALAAFTLLAAMGPVVIQLLRNDPITLRHYAAAVIGLVIMIAVVVASLPRRFRTAAGAAVILSLAVLTGWQFSVSSKDDWRDVLSTVAHNQLAGDLLLCFPEHHCVVAAGQYLPQELPIHGGLVIRDNPSVFFGPEGVPWTGYLAPTAFQDYTPLSGADLKSRLDEEVAGSKRIWLIAGNGDAVHYPTVGAVEEALARDWSVTQEWSDPPLDLKLYDRRRGR